MPFPTDPAYAAGLTEAQELAARGSHQEALDRCVPLLAHAGDPFRRAYLLGLIAALANATGRFPEAEQAYQYALADARAIPRPDFLADFSLELGELYLNLGRPREAEACFARAGREFGVRAGPEQSFAIRQGLANCCLDQGKYRRAKELVAEMAALPEFSRHASRRLGIAFLEARVALFLGEEKAVHRVIGALQQNIQGGGQTYLLPYLELLQGKVALIEGRYQESLRHFEKADAGFAAQGDLTGRVEARLAMTAPMLEFRWIREAQRILHPLAMWERGEEFPALRHSIQLRRLALSAFLGVWVKRDLDLLREDPHRRGSLEEWIQFWFHLSLA
ncbi:MAG: hypothetical protein ACREP8_10490, partial [Candidatus Binatia bacterium]